MDNNTNKKPTKTNMPKFNLNWLYMIIAMMLLGLYLTNESGTSSKNIPYDEFQEYVRNGYISKVTGYDDNSVEAYVKPQYVPNVFKADSSRVGKNPLITTEAPSRESLGDFLQKEKDETRFDGSISYEKKRNYFGAILWQILPFAFLIGFWIFLSRRWSGGGGMGGGSGIFSVGKSKAQLFEKNSPVKVTFKDVAGLAEAKQEVEEIVEFLKQPQKYTDLGGKIPKGALLVGPPGTGKTLLAKAVAGEANVPFFSLAGSDFVEMFVGVGASRVRDLFDQAKKNSPCIVFIDEIDAVGRKRGAGLGGGHDEREQTLNQLLVEMDGFGINEGVIVMAATNRADILDPAILRPGRFDRQVYVGRPDVKGREAILRVHAAGKPFADDVDFSVVAKTTSGFTGADLENLLNEAALLTARAGKKKIDMEEVQKAFVKVGIGTEKKSRIISEKEKLITAYHESGHAILFEVLEKCDPVHSVSIIPTGMAGGYTMPLPGEDKMYMTKGEMEDEIISFLGGRAAEEIVLKDITTGASNDIERATAMARNMVMKYGMSSTFGPVQYGDESDEVFIGRDIGHSRNYSENTADAIDAEVKELINFSYNEAKRLLNENIDVLHASAKLLMEKEKITGDEFRALFKKDSENISETDDTAAVTDTTDEI